MRKKFNLRTGWALLASAVLGLVVFGPLLAPYAPTASAGPPLRGPSARHLLGTDVIGRDVLSRVLHGGLPLVSIATVAILVAYAIGLCLGLVAGLRRGLDGWIMRPVDAILVVPWFLLLAVIATAVGGGPTAVVLTTAFACVPWIIRIVRTAVLDIAATGYVESARARGEPLWRLAVVEVLPNLRSVVLADAGVRISLTISMVAVSGFLGLGLRPPSADWALMITENRPGFARQPLSVLAPTVLIMLLVVSINMLTDRALGTRRGRRTAIVRGGDGGIRVEHLTVRDQDDAIVLDDVTLDVPPGRGLAVVGPSGAGKTTLALAALGALPPQLRTEGVVMVGTGERRIGYVPQDPAAGLNPAMRVATAIREIARLQPTSDLEATVATALRRVGLPDDARFRRRYPHELSGGQQQRVLLAMALIGDPAVIVLDEPTTGLDQQTRAELVELLTDIRRTTSTALLVVTHDLPGLAPVIDEVAQLDTGRIVSRAPYRRTETSAAVTPACRPAASSDTPVLHVEALTVGHRQQRGFLPVAENLSFDLHPGECVAITGRSGAGKTTVARVVAGLHQPETGTIELDGQRLLARVDQRSPEQRGAIQLIFQNPATSLNPSYTVGTQIHRPLRLRGMDNRAAAEEAARLLESVHLDPALAIRRPTELSGGQQQRVALARAMAASPRILICDEITSSLDPRTQSLILTLLNTLKSQGTALILITHQHTAIHHLADTTVALDAASASLGA
ncbi:ABC transporter ATP-binding protein/permease [Nocardia callitridis]|uniref:Uncharacterized protein n=1 Tax=Nocardia callitridis TaxID=648753 RepID=A0ABP9K2A8_9NOCA